MTEASFNAECESLIAQVRMGNSNAFQKLYDLTSPKVYGFLLKMLRSQDLAEDVMQEAYVKLWSTANKYDTRRGTVMAWIHTIARYKALDTIALQKKHHETVDDIEELQLMDSLDTINDLQEADSIHNCMQQLASSQRAGIFAAFFQGLTYVELAQSASVPLSTIKSRIRRGLARLKDCLEQL